MEKIETEIKEKEKQQENQAEKQEKQKEKTKQEETQKNKIKLKTAIIAITLIIILVASTIFALLNINNQNIISGVTIEQIEVAGLTQKEAKEKIENKYNEKKEKELLLKHEDYDTTINAELLELNYEIEKATEEAINIGRNSNIFVNNYNIIQAMLGKKDIKVEIQINEEMINQTIADIETNMPGAIKEPSYYIENNKLIITKGKEGLDVNKEKLTNQIKKYYEKTTPNQEYIEIPVENKKPEEINIEKIHEEIYKEVQDAYFTKDPFVVHPEVIGVDFDIEEAKKQLQEDKEQYEINLKITKPQVTTAEIGTEAFPNQLSTFSTRYDASQSDRSTNLRLACQKINDKVILPGETFSYNQALGERTPAAGYKYAKVYEAGQVVDGIGGGICQISSTLYNAVLMANMEVTERRNHQFITSYTPAGRDATVVYGQTDFKFKNTRTTAVRIKATAVNGVATVAIYGIKEEKEYNITFSTKTISTIPYTVKYIDDSSLPVGQEKIIQKGANGVITETYITKSLNGKVISTNLLSKDTYNAMQRIIQKGTQGAETSIEPQPVEQTPEPTTPTAVEPTTQTTEQPVQ